MVQSSDGVCLAALSEHPVASRYPATALDPAPLTL